jgi:hypothetical protein
VRGVDRAVFSFVNNQIFRGLIDINDANRIIGHVTGIRLHDAGLIEYESPAVMPPHNSRGRTFGAQPTP